MMLRSARSGSDDGFLQISTHTYNLSTSAIKYWDFGFADGVTVGHLIGLIGQYKRQKYRMAENGVGCRYWM